MLIFGGGRKTKGRGSVPYPCSSCGQLAMFELTENYGYAHLYFVRVVKHGTNRYLVCSSCGGGHELTKNQWERARVFANEFNRLPPNPPVEVIGSLITRFAESVLPTDAPRVRQLTTFVPERVEQQQPQHLDSSRQALPAGNDASAEETKACPDCAENVKFAARKCRFCGFRFDTSPDGA